MPEPTPPKPPARWRRTRFSWRRNLPLALACLGVLLALSIALPLPALQAFDGAEAGGPGPAAGR